MKIQSITSKECRNGKMMHTVQFSDGDYADLNIGFFGEFPFKVGDNITANIKKDKSGAYLNGYDPVIAKVASPDPLEGQKVNGVVAPAKAPILAFDYNTKLDGVLQQLQVMNEHMNKIELLLEQLPQKILEAKK